MEKQITHESSRNRGGGTIDEQKIGWTRDGMWKMYLPPPGQRRTAIKKHFVAALGEFVGTTLFLFFAIGGTSVANTPSSAETDTAINTNVDPSQLLYISLSFGLSLLVCAWTFFRVSGGLFNPAVSLGLCLVGGITPLRAVILIISQVAGAIAGSALVKGLLGNLFARTTLKAGISVARGLFLEMFLTSMLMLTILLLAAEKHKATFLAPVGIGLALFIAELVGVYNTGGSLNPARSFGPDVVTGTFDSYHWIYWLGPAMGACLAAGFYKLIKWLSYEDVVPDQDATGAAEAEAAHAETEAREAEEHAAAEREAAGIEGDDTVVPTTSRSSGTSSLRLGKPIAGGAAKEQPTGNVMSFEQASRLEAKLDLVLNKKADANLEKKLDLVLAAIARETESDAYWSLGGERRKQKEKGAHQQKVHKEGQEKEKHGHMFGHHHQQQQQQQAATPPPGTPSRTPAATPGRK